MQNSHSEADLISFLDYVAQKGLVKEATAKSRKIAAIKVLSALDDHEKIDLRNVDRENAFQRFVNKYGKEFSPDSLTTYKSRFNSALDDFVRYQSNPAAYKPSTQQRASRKGREVPETPRKTSSEELPQPQRNYVATPPSSQASLVFPIPLRTGLVVEIHNLPYDLTQAEAQRIGAVIRALAAPSEKDAPTMA